MNRNDEIGKKLKRVQWIRTVINHHLDDVEEILKSVMEIKNSSSTESDKLPKYIGWDSYNNVFDHISLEKSDPEEFVKRFEKLMYAMSRNGFSREEACGVLNRLISVMTQKGTIQSIRFMFNKFYPQVVDVDDSDLFGGDIGMP